ncbi:MAG TPA: alkaline phosphatase family protein [Anaerolineales bacterium]
MTSHGNDTPKRAMRRPMVRGRERPELIWRMTLRTFPALLILMLAAVSVTTASAAQGKLEQGSQSALSSPLTFTATADSRVTGASPTTNYGTSTYMQVDADNGVLRSYIRFTVSGLTAPVQSATLRVYCTTNGTLGGPTVYLAGSNWIESGAGSITWNNQPGLLSGALAHQAVISTGSWVSYNVTPVVTGNGTFTFALLPSSTDGVTFSTREGAEPPQLVITSSSSSLPTPISTSTQTPTPAVMPTNTATPQVPSPTPSTSGSIKHVFVVLMENHSYSEVWNTSSSPYISSLGNASAYATNYHAVTHPSLPNYLDIYGGSNYGITNDCSPSSSCHVNARNLADNLDAKGLTWKSYEESMPAPCYLTSSGSYAPKHNPMIYFDDIFTNTTRCNSHDVPFTSLSADLASASTTPSYAFITPNLCDDMHDCSVSTGDTWLKGHLPAILSSPACTVDKCLLILTWDEDDGSAGNHVLTIFAGSGAKTGGVTSSVAYTHFSLLRTVEYIFGLPTQTSNDANASPMTDLLR